MAALAMQHAMSSPRVLSMGRPSSFSCPARAQSSLLLVASLVAAVATGSGLESGQLRASRTASQTDPWADLQPELDSSFSAFVAARAAEAPAGTWVGQAQKDLSALEAARVEHLHSLASKFREAVLDGDAADSQGGDVVDPQGPKQAPTQGEGPPPAEGADLGTQRGSVDVASISESSSLVAQEEQSKPVVFDSVTAEDDASVRAASEKVELAQADSVERMIKELGNSDFGT